MRKPLEAGVRVGFIAPMQPMLVKTSPEGGAPRATWPERWRATRRHWPLPTVWRRPTPAMPAGSATSRSHDKIGDVRNAQGNLAGAPESGEPD
jgi:hypothetical protein